MKSVSHEALLQSENNDLRAQIADLEGKLTRVMTEKNMSSTEISSIFKDQKQLSELKSKLRESQLESSKYRAILEAQESSILNSFSVDENLKSQILDTKNQISLENVQREKEQLHELSVAQLEISKLRNQLCSSEAKNAEQLLRIKELESRLGEIDGNDQYNGAVNKRLQGSIGDLQLKYEQLQVRYQESLKNIDKIKEQAKFDQEKLNQQIKQLNDQNLSYKQKIATDTAQITRLDGQLVTAKSQIARCEQLVSQLENNRQSTQQEQQQQIVQLKNQISDLNNEINRIKEEKQNLMQNNENLQKKNNELQNIISKNKIENENLNNQINLLKDDFNQKQTDNQSLLQKYKDIQNKYQALQVNFEENQREKIKVQNELRNLSMEHETQIRKSTIQSNAMEQSISGIKNENEKLIQQIKLKDEQIRSLENRQAIDAKEKQTMHNDIENIQNKFNKLLQLLNDEKTKVVQLESQISTMKTEQSTKIYDPEKELISKQLDFAQKENLKLQNEIGSIQQRIQQDRLLQVQLTTQLEDAQQKILDLTKEKKTVVDPQIPKIFSNKVLHLFKKFCKVFILRIAVLETHINVISNSLIRLQNALLSNTTSQQNKIDLAVHREVIDLLSKKAARAYHVHSNEVPSAALLVNNANVRNEFLSKLVKKHNVCHHTDEDVQRVLNSVVLYRV